MGYILMRRDLDWDAYGDAIVHTDGSFGRDRDVYYGADEIARRGGMKDFLSSVAEAENASWGSPVLVSVYRRGSEHETVVCLTGEEAAQ